MSASTGDKTPAIPVPSDTPTSSWVNRKNSECCDLRTRIYNLRLQCGHFASVPPAIPPPAAPAAAAPPGNDFSPALFVVSPGGGGAPLSRQEAGGNPREVPALQAQ